MGHLARVGDHPFDVVEIRTVAQLVDAFVGALDDHDFVTGCRQVAGDERADLACSDDEDSHQ